MSDSPTTRVGAGRLAALYARVQRTIHEVLDLSLSVGVNFHLVNHDQLLALADRHTANPLENDARQRCFGLPWLW